MIDISEETKKEIIVDYYKDYNSEREIVDIIDMQPAIKEYLEKHPGYRIVGIKECKLMYHGERKSPGIWLSYIVEDENKEVFTVSSSCDAKTEWMETLYKICKNHKKD